MPHLTKNLLSISQFTSDNNIVLEFDSSCCLVKDKTTRSVLLRGTLNDRLYKIDVSSKLPAGKSLVFSRPSTPLNNAEVYNCTTTSNPVRDKSKTLSTWHCRLGHHSLSVFSRVMHVISPSIKATTVPFCDACQLGKMHQFAFKSSINKTTHAFQLIHSDVWGPSIHTPREGFKYYCSFVDDYTRFT